MKESAIRRLLAFACIPAIAVLLLLSLAAPAAASVAVPTSDELAGFLDPIVARQLTQYDIPGAVVVVVKDGQILYKQGYGFANLAQRTPFDPDRTLFTIGSVAKLFTATSPPFRFRPPIPSRSPRPTCSPIPRGSMSS